MISLISAVAARLLRGAVLRTPRFIVGPDTTGQAAWACFTVPEKVLIRFVECWKVDGQEQEQHDWSAFGAASAFCMVERPEAVRKALLDLHRSHCRKMGCEACEGTRGRA